MTTQASGNCCHENNIIGEGGWVGDMTGRGGG